MKSPQQIVEQTMGLLRRLGGLPGKGYTRGEANSLRIKRVIQIRNRYMHNILTYYGHGHVYELSDEEYNRPLPRHTYGLPRPQREYSMTITPYEL